MSTRRWFHQNITGMEAEKLLMDKGREGSFLCRPSGTSKNSFTLSVKRDGSVTHIKIQNHGDRFDLYGGESFSSLTELIQYYRKNGLTEKNGEVIQLLHPVNLKDPTSERWFHGHMSGTDAERLLLDEGKNGSYLVRESANHPGHYVITMRSDDHVKHVKLRNEGGRFDLGGDPSFISIPKLIEFYEGNPMVEENGGTVLHLKQPFNSTKFTASSIADRLVELKKETKLLPGKDCFWEEFEQLQQQETRHRYTRRCGTSAENKNKNRYKNIVPFDHSRVILEDSENDYINASFIGEDNNRRAYIATQGCLVETINDFWRMVYQQNCRVIFMLAQEVEKGKPRCAKYWPDIDSNIDVKTFTVSNRMETVTPEFTLRELVVKSNDEIPSHEPYTIYQYQYVAWPEHSYPENPGSILGILHDINLRLKGFSMSPLVVHCSNGIGRTAALIVIDMVVKILQKEGLECEIDIQKTVQHVRTQRSLMVQLEAQYKFIYLALAHYVEMENLLVPLEMKNKRSTSHTSKTKKTDMTVEPPLPRSRNSASSSSSSSNNPPPPPISHRLPPKPPVITINGTLPPPIPQRKAGNDTSMCDIFSKPQHVEDPPLPNTPPPIPERKKGK